MTLRRMRRAVVEGRWVLEVPGAIRAATQFQKERLTEAVTGARLYLKNGTTAKHLGRMWGVTEERAAQIIRLGITYLLQAGRLYPRAPEQSVPIPGMRARSSHGRGRG